MNMLINFIITFMELCHLMPTSMEMACLKNSSSCFWKFWLELCMESLLPLWTSWFSNTGKYNSNLIQCIQVKIPLSISASTTSLDTLKNPKIHAETISMSITICTIWRTLASTIVSWTCILKQVSTMTSTWSSQVCIILERKKLFSMLRRQWKRTKLFFTFLPKLEIHN